MNMGYFEKIKKFLICIYIKFMVFACMFYSNVVLCVLFD